MGGVFLYLQMPTLNAKVANLLNITPRTFWPYNCLATQKSDQMKHALILLLSLIPIITLAQSDQINSAIAKQGEAFLKHKDITSVSIGVYKNGQTYTQHFGSLVKEQDVVPTDQTIYEIGSVSKTMTGYLVAKAVIDNKLNLNDEVTQYLPAGYDNLAFNEQPITIQHLLTHTSGLPMFLPEDVNGLFESLSPDVPQKYLETEKDYSKAKFLKDLESVTLKQAPGNEYAYSNVGAELLGYILETAYGQNLDKLLQEAFLSRLTMRNTEIQLSTGKENLAKGYWMSNKQQSPNQLNPLWGTAGGVKMNMEDLLKYMALQLNSENPIVSESHRELFARGKTAKLAYFWNVWTDKYGTSYNHHGGTSGTQNWLYIFPKYKLGISIITNNSGPKTPTLLNKTVKKLLKDIVKD